MERLTRPTVEVDETAARYMAAPGCIPADLRSMKDRLLDLVLNGPTLNGVNKDTLRQLIRQLYAALKPYEDTGLSPDEAKDMAENAETRLLTWFESRYGFPVGELMGLLEAKQQGRLVVLPCRVGSTVYQLRHKRHARGEGIAPRIVSCACFWSDGSYTLAHQGMTYCTSNELGRTWFLTVEDAERALEGGQTT